VAPLDATEKNRNVGAQVQSILCTTAGKGFWEIYVLYDFWCSQTCSFRAVFWTTDTKYDTRCQRYVATCGNFFI